MGSKFKIFSSDSSKSALGIMEYAMNRWLEEMEGRIKIVSKEIVTSGPDRDVVVIFYYEEFH